jgi:hypothetical protein
MAAPTNAASEDSSCQPGAVHTWPVGFLVLTEDRGRGIRCLPTVKKLRFSLHLGSQRFFAGPSRRKATGAWLSLLTDPSNFKEKEGTVNQPPHGFAGSSPASPTITQRSDGLHKFRLLRGSKSLGRATIRGPKRDASVTPGADRQRHRLFAVRLGPRPSNVSTPSPRRSAISAVNICEINILDE